MHRPHPNTPPGPTSTHQLSPTHHPAPITYRTGARPILYRCAPYTVQVRANRVIVTYRSTAIAMKVKVLAAIVQVAMNCDSLQ